MGRGEKPLFSIVIPCYDSEEFLSETLGSLSAQTCADFEVVLVDDGSRDNSLEVARAELQRLALRGIAVSRPGDIPKGVASCRNIGVALSTGEWIAFLDSDDLFAPVKLERVAAVVRAEAFEEECHAICHPSKRFSNETGADLGETGRLAPGGPRWLLDRLLAEGNWFATCGMVVRRSLFDEIGGFDGRLNGVEDWWLCLQICSRTPWAYIDEPLASIRLRAQSLMQGRRFVSYARQFALLLSAARDANDLTPDQFARLVAYVRTGAGRHYAARAANEGKWRDVMQGCAEFAAAGFPGVGARILALLLKRAVLETAWNAKHQVLGAAADAARRTTDPAEQPKTSAEAPPARESVTTSTH